VTTESMMSVADVCESAGVTRQTIARWVRRGIMPSPVRLGPRCVRWPRDVIEQWLRNGAVRVHASPIGPLASTWLPDEPMADSETLAALDETE